MAKAKYQPDVLLHFQGSRHLGAANVSCAQQVPTCSTREAGIRVAAEEQALAEPKTSLLTNGPLLWKSLAVLLHYFADVSSALYAFFLMA